MTLVTFPGASAGEEARSGSELHVSETYWGYQIRNREDRFDRETLAEHFLRFLGLVFVAAAYGQWLLPERLFQGDAVVVKATICFLLGVAGMTLYGFANRGFSLSVEVDLARREIRVVRRSSQGRRRLETAVQMERVESAFLQRSKDRSQPTHLCLRIRSPEAVLHVARGRERDLEPLFRRIRMDVRPVRDRLDAKLAGSVGFRSRRAV